MWPYDSIRDHNTWRWTSCCRKKVQSAELDPTRNLRELCRQVVLRLAAEQRLELRFRLRMEIRAGEAAGGGVPGPSTVSPPRQAVEQINKLLSDIAHGFMLG